MIIKAVIIDDESLSRENIRNLIERYFYKSVQLVGEADDVGSGISLIHSLKPDIVFLDIQMPSGTGFDLLSEVETESFETIFITAFHEYAIKAFRFNSLDYFDFGISTVSGGKEVNSGLLYWKECFGARTTANKTYGFDLKQTDKLKALL